MITKRELDRCARTAARGLTAIEKLWLTSSVVSESQSLRVSASASNLDNSLTHQSFDLLRPQLCDVVGVAETSVFTYGNKKLGYVSSPKSSRPCGAMKMAKSCKEGTAAKQRRSGSEGCKFKTQCQQGLFTAESPLIYPSSNDLYTQFLLMGKMY